MDILLYVVIFLILCAEFINGWTDAPNAIATVVSTRVLSLKTAVMVAASFNILGAFMGTAVAATIGTGIIKTESMDLITLAGAIFSVIVWGLIAWYFALPTSKSHALIAGIAGAGLAVGGKDALLWEGWEKVFLGLFFSTVLGLLGGWVIAKLIPLFFSHTSPMKSRKLFGRLQVLSASFMAFSHGSNDGQKFIGVFSLALLLGGVYSEFHIPIWVIFICAVVMGIGTSIGGMRIIRTMGVKMVHLETYEGFSAETGSATTILLASHFGIPLSTTHTISMAIVGIGVAKPKKAVRWSVVKQIIYAWMITFPFCGLLAYITAAILKIL
jgi:PiT family inorganic phosphate transporter